MRVGRAVEEDHVQFAASLMRINDQLHLVVSRSGMEPYITPVDEALIPRFTRGGDGKLMQMVD